MTANRSAASSGLRCDSFTKAPPISSATAAIDAFYLRSQKILVDASRPSIDPLICSLIGVGLIAAAEAYIRDIIVGMMKICPIARKRCKSEAITIGAFNYYGQDGIGFSLADSISFSNSSTISEKIKLLSGLKSKDSEPLTVALEEFARICNIRHSIVHACGLVSHHHIEGAGINATDHPTYVSFDFNDIQVVSAVCHNLVRILNEELFQKSLKDWINEQELSGAWTNDKMHFTGLVKLFVSKSDRSQPINPYNEWQKIRSILISRNSE
jgi:hypothetical protein